MSLTSHLADRASPVYQFFAKRVPLAASREAARVLNTEARASMPWGGPLVVAGTVPTLAGSAFDFGFRHWISPFGPAHLPGTALRGAANAQRFGWLAAPMLVKAIIEALPTLEPLEQARCFVALAAKVNFAIVPFLVKAMRLSADEEARLYLALVPNVGPLAHLRVVGLSQLKSYIKETAKKAEVSVRKQYLSPSEEKVLRLSLEGLTSQEIASRLVVTKGTVDTHWIRILRKVGFQRRAQALNHFRAHPDKLQNIIRPRQSSSAPATPSLFRPVSSKR